MVARRYSGWTAIAAALLLTACSDYNNDTPNEKAVSAKASDARAISNTSKEAPPSKRGQCAFSAWAYDEDPKGTNVRAGAGKSFPVIATLPQFKLTESGLRGSDAVTFDVVEAKDGWFRIKNAQLFPMEADKPEATYPDGWVHGSKISFALQSDYAFEHPDPKSKRVATSWQSSDGIHGLKHRNPDDCQGEWVHLQVSDHDSAYRPAWVRGVCGVLETTCDGVLGDGPENSTYELPIY
jgi:hypothetical protein